MPFASGVLAALVALLVYKLLLPGPPPLTTREVSDTVAQTLASATVPPAFSARVYQVIQPSLVLIQTDLPGANGEVAHGVGSGVIVDDRGDILTSLHVIAGASAIQLTFADGTQSGAEVLVEQPEHDIAVLHPAPAPSPDRAGDAGQPERHARRRRGVCRRQSAGPVQLDERGRDLRLRSHLPPPRQRPEP